MDECDRTKRWILFFPLTIVKCKKDHTYRERPSGKFFAVISTNSAQYVKKQKQMTIIMIIINNNDNNNK